MECFIGFMIAFFISLTGVGAGTITVPVLVLFLGVPARVAVGLGLTFSAVVKLILAPAQIVRKNVAWPTLGYMVLGGVPGVLAGSFLLKQMVTAGSQSLLNVILGLILVTIASWQIVFMIYRTRDLEKTKDRSRWMPWLMLPVGAEVGFSSAGAGALGNAALLSLTPLTPAEVVGTDIVFGLILSLVGSGAHWFSWGMRQSLLLHLVEGGIGGAVVGTMLSRSIPRRPLRFALWIWILFLGGNIVLSNFHGFIQR